ncbi:MAG TPA: protease pro-enzyme activation domain-containing protein [Capsulimonadaceae bacterium]|nr:protease pro-enzyme activation domain-containing protein [Capsulimonadaceae bacterium]
MYAVSSKESRLVRGLVAFVVLLLSSLFTAQARAFADPLVRMPNASTPSQAHGMMTGRLANETPVNLAITLPLRNQAALSQLLTRLYNPNDPLYGQYLSPQEFTDRFAPTPEQYAAVAAYAQAYGLQVATHPNQLVLDIAGPAAAIEAAFSVHLNTFQSSDGQRFFAADNAPALPATIAGLVSSIQGLDGSVSLHPNVLIQSRPPSGLFTANARANSIGHGVSGGLTPADIKAAYSSAPVAQDGAGQRVALFELDDYTDNEVAQYEHQYFRLDRRLAQISRVAVDGGPGGPSGGQGELEVALDIDMNLALAPHAKNIYVYEAPNTAAGIIDEYNQIAVDNKARVVSTSWGIWEDEFGGSHAMQDVENEIFQEMAAQGQSVYAATGDYGAYDPYTGNVSAQDPATQPWVCAVGGTHLSLKTNGTYDTESGWWNGPTGSSYTYGYGTGGGVSSYWQIPGYQSSYSSSYFDNIGQYLSSQAMADMASQQNRNVPDVSLAADPATGYDIYTDADGYGWISAGGTSAAVQVWGAFTVLVNQARAGVGDGSVGFPSVTLYSIAATADGANALHDVSGGLNGNGYWSTGNGYDDTTGLGSFNMSGLMQRMRRQPTGLAVPSAPSNVTATPGDRSLSATCSPSPGAVHYLWFLASSAGTTGTLVGNTTKPTVQVRSLTNGASYQLYVIAVNNAGQSMPSPYSNTVVPEGVVIAGGPSTITVGSRQLTVTWSTNLNSNAVIQYGATPRLGITAQRLTLAQNHSITLSGLVPGKTYYFRVLSSDGITSAASTGSFKP